MIKRRRKEHPRDRLHREVVIDMHIRGMDLEWARAYACEVMLADQGHLALLTHERPPSLACRKIEPARPIEHLRWWEVGMAEKDAGRK